MEKPGVQKISNEEQKIRNKIQNLFLLSSPPNNWLEKYLRHPKETLQEICQMENIRNPMKSGGISPESIHGIIIKTIAARSNNDFKKIFEILNHSRFEESIEKIAHNLPAYFQFDIREELFKRHLENSVENKAYSSPSRNF